MLQPWSGTEADLSTTFVNSTLVTAVIPASSFAAAGSNAVKVFNPAPGGGSSSELTFTVPCPVPAPAAASAQTKARLGAYYFDGWSGPLTNFHFQGLPLGLIRIASLFPLGRTTPRALSSNSWRLRITMGVIFVFDWYFNVQVTDPEENLNSGLQITHSLANRHGMQYAILYVDDPPFDVGPSDWNSAVNEWVGYMTDPDYLRINGLPALFIINVGEMRQIFGTAVAVSSALAQLRTAAQAQGLPGVYVVGGFGVPSNAMGQPSLTSGFDIAQSDGYDAVAFYGYSFAPTPALGPLPFSTLSGAGQWTWDQAAQYSALPFIPTAMSGWDPRPWNEIEPTTGDYVVHTRTPQDLIRICIQRDRLDHSQPAVPAGAFARAATRPH